MVCNVSNKNALDNCSRITNIVCKILSIRVAEFAVPLVGRVINGTSMLLYI